MSYTISTMRDLKRVSRETGGHFFDAGAMRFFDSRVSDQIWANDDTSGYFVTSERYDDESPRLYTVRSYKLTTRDDGTAWLDIDTAGEFQEWETLAEAKRAAQSHWRNHAYAS